MMQNIKTIAVTTIISATVILTGCTNNMNSTQQDTIGGAVLGAAAGAAIAGVSGGNVGTGALIGTAVGGIGGALVGSSNSDNHNNK